MRKEDFQELEMLKRRLLAVDALTKTDGWKVYEQMLHDAERHAYMGMVTEGNAHKSVVQMGAYHCLRSIREWPEREIDVIRRRIHALDTAQ